MRAGLTEQRDGLPKRRTGRLTAWLDRSSLWRILIVGLAVYSIVPVTLSVVELACASAGHVLINNADGNPALSFWDLLYFNFTTILTVGYGDYVPVSTGRLLSVAEAIFGLVLFGAIISVATIKAMLPPKNAVAFSKYGYYCTEDESFLVLREYDLKFSRKSRDVLILSARRPLDCQAGIPGPIYRAFGLDVLHRAHDDGGAHQWNRPG